MPSRREMLRRKARSKAQSLAGTARRAAGRAKDRAARQLSREKARERRQKLKQTVKKAGKKADQMAQGVEEADEGVFEFSAGDSAAVDEQLFGDAGRGGMDGDKMGGGTSYGLDNMDLDDARGDDPLIAESAPAGSGFDFGIGAGGNTQDVDLGFGLEEMADQPGEEMDPLMGPKVGPDDDDYYSWL
jgi:hypothetical protein